MYSIVAFFLKMNTQNMQELYHGSLYQRLEYWKVLFCVKFKQEYHLKLTDIKDLKIKGQEMVRSEIDAKSCYQVPIDPSQY